MLEDNGTGIVAPADRGKTLRRKGRPVGKPTGRDLP